jgi:hypothetical protein
MADADKLAEMLQRFFKTGQGQYGKRIVFIAAPSYKNTQGKEPKNSTSLQLDKLAGCFTLVFTRSGL